MVVAREDTQAKMDQLAAATLRHTPVATLHGRRPSRGEGPRPSDRSVHPLRGHDARLRDRQRGARTESRTRSAPAASRPARGARSSWRTVPSSSSRWLGLAKLGVTVALINTQLRGEVLRHALATTDAQARVRRQRAAAGAREHPAGRTPGAADLRRRGPSGSRQRRRLPRATVVALDRLAAAMPASDLDVAVRAHLRGGDDLFHIFTSGTTGLPKAARLSHMRYLGVGDGMSAIAGYGPDDVIACVLPLYHGAGGMVVVSCALAQGAAIALRRRFSTSRFWDEARRDSVTACQYVGELCRYLLNAPPSPADRDHRHPRDDGRGARRRHLGGVPGALRHRPHPRGLELDRGQHEPDQPRRPRRLVRPHPVQGASQRPA